MVYFGKKSLKNPQVEQNKEDIEQIEQELQSFAKLGLSNTFTAENYFNSNLNVRNSRYRIRNNDNIVFELYKGTDNNNSYVEAKAGDLVLSGTNVSVNNKKVINVANPTENNDAANKEYVDNRIKYLEKAGGLSFTRQELDAGKVNKYWARINYSSIGIPNGKQIISCYSKSIPVSGAHLVITFFPAYNTNECLIEIYQYASSTDITTNLNGATYCFTYIN